MHHFAVIDFIDDKDEEELANQQSKLDDFDDDVAQITARMEELAARRPPAVDKVANVTFKRLKYLERAFAIVSENLSSLDTGDNTCLLQQHQEHLQDLKKELSDVHQEYMSADHGEFDSISILDMLKGGHFTLSLQVRKLLRSAPPPPLIDTLKPVKLPTLEIPMFDGSILNWTTFWEQFDISIHSRFDLATAEKLAYLRMEMRKLRLKDSVDLENNTRKQSLV